MSILQTNPANVETLIANKSIYPLDDLKDISSVDVMSYFAGFEAVEATASAKEKSVVKETEDDAKEEYRCKHCKSTCEPMLIKYETFCPDCNTSLEKIHIDMTSECRFYGADDSKSKDSNHYGMPTNALFPNLSMSTSIGSGGKKTKDFYNLRRYQRWNGMPYKEMSLFAEIDSIATQAVNGKISTDVIEQAKMLYKQVYDLKISRGVNRQGLKACSVYISCQLNGVPRSMKEIAEMYKVEQSTLTKGYKIFNRVMDLDIECSMPKDFIPRFCSKLGMEDKYQKLCKHIINEADKYSIITDSVSHSIVAGVIFMVNQLCSLGHTKKEIKEVCGTSEPTITKCYNKLAKYIKVLFKDNPELLEEYQINLEEVAKSSKTRKTRKV